MLANNFCFDERMYTYMPITVKNNMQRYMFDCLLNSTAVIQENDRKAAFLLLGTLMLTIVSGLIRYPLLIVMVGERLTSPQNLVVIS